MIRSQSVFFCYTTTFSSETPQYPAVNTWSSDGAPGAGEEITKSSIIVHDTLKQVF